MRHTLNALIKLIIRIKYSKVLLLNVNNNKRKNAKKKFKNFKHLTQKRFLL